MGGDKTDPDTTLPPLMLELAVRRRKSECRTSPNIRLREAFLQISVVTALVGQIKIGQAHFRRRINERPTTCLQFPKLVFHARPCLTNLFLRVINNWQGLCIGKGNRRRSRIKLPRQRKLVNTRLVVPQPKKCIGKIQSDDRVTGRARSSRSKISNSIPDPLRTLQGIAKVVQKIGIVWTQLDGLEKKIDRCFPTP